MPEEPRYNGRTAIELASDAENALLGIVHLNEGDAPLSAPESVYRTLSGLTRMLEQLPEAVTRLSAALQTEQQHGRLSVATGRYRGDPKAAVGAMSDAVDEFLATCTSALTNLEQAQAAVSELHAHEATA